MADTSKKMSCALQGEFSQWKKQSTSQLLLGKKLESQDHRVTEWLRSEGTLEMLYLTKDLLPTLPPWAGVLSLHSQVSVEG